MAYDPSLYPEFKKPGPTNGKTSETPSSISSSSSSSTSSAASTVTPAARHRGRTTIVISSDEENEDIPPSTQSQSSAQPPPTAPNNFVMDALKQALPKPPPQRTQVPAPIHVPSNRDILPGPSNPTIDAAHQAYVYEPRMSATETEKALRALVEDSITPDDVEINMEEAIVEGFQDGITLLPHQVLGRAWMRDKETDKKRGGILADDMGLGKTIQTLTRIVDGRAKKSDKADGWAATTLVVCPVALVSQWASEITKMAVGLRVIEHHGQSRTTDPLKLKAAHVVVTSYSIVASEYATFAPPAKDESKSKSKSKKASSQSDSGSDSDDVVTKKKPGRAKGKDALFRVKWFRIVLDEAHNIKNRNTKAAIACCELEGKFRWCLTGTPMQNTVDELFSLLKFLRVRPLNDWQNFNEQIAQPIKAGRPVRALKRLHVVLQSIMLRRTKDFVLNGKPIISLPARHLSVVQCKFDSDEQAFYNTLSQRMTNELDKLVQANEASKNYTHVLLMLLRLRQACNHPSLVYKDYRIDNEAAEPRPAKNDEADEDADELAALLGQMGVSNGKKCQLCQTNLDSSDSEHCPDCEPIAAKARRRSVAAPTARDPNLPPDSAKIRKLLEILRDIDERSESAEKTIIFSQFTSMLNLIEPFLTAEGIKYARYDGSMTKDKREASLEKIRSSKSTRCILISFKAGSTGLNLTCCNNVILVDMWWNPALEDQAFDRAHRYGQKRDVNIFKLTIPETVETRILELQEKKRELTKAALSGEKMKNMKLGMDDLLALFRPGAHHDDDDDEE
ncbi:SNF2 family N-terminal domain-containing protein [Suillus clintonianus]|uniref:SNF2 family N-terminal domain-containing protein n=1 Tax=Suillus clintonianus TaxID=1904413 RepID=UPI001B87DF60|nr:SNF2 family N-terminal domain-containing protein [Suillus clintonianus]KAG2134132.1 SNF2 family N-terminal domain-containing protein [Suillus clintonianus]